MNNYLELLLYRNQFQLATVDALYSDGDRYRPATAALDHLKGKLSATGNVLVLGAGLGSMVRAMRKYGYDPRFTLVDIDKVVLKWAMECLDDERISSIVPVCDSAQRFIAETQKKYDLIFIDVFSGRVVPAFVTSAAFLEQCRECLAPGGFVAFNYIINDQKEWEEVQRTCSLVLPGYKVIDLGANRIIIAKASS